MISYLRIYQPDELGSDGYPFAWHGLDGGRGIKHFVRAQAGDRCVRCLHPYVKGAGEWSPCDKQCHHGGPVRFSDLALPVGVDEYHLGAEGIAYHRERGSSVEARWRILTVHHLNGQKADCRWWNLAALCQRCHLTIQGRVIMERIWPWPHSEWFKPYAAGWYAHAYLGLDLSREETMARLEELLALEQQASA